MAKSVKVSTAINTNATNTVVDPTSPFLQNPYRGYAKGRSARANPYATKPTTGTASTSSATAQKPAERAYRSLGLFIDTTHQAPENFEVVELLVSTDLVPPLVRVVRRAAFRSEEDAALFIESVQLNEVLSQLAEEGPPKKKEKK